MTEETKVAAAPQNISEIRQMLNTLTNDLAAAIPESYFVQHMLPIMAGDAGHTSLEPWIQATGSIFNKAYVYDAHGKRLFDIPAMGRSIDTPTGREPRSSLFEIMAGYEQRLALSPIYAKNYWDNALSTKVIKPEVDLAELEAIDNILERYNRPRRFNKGIAMNAVATTVTQPTLATPDEIGDDL